MGKKEIILVILFLVVVSVVFFYKFVIFGLIPFPGDLLIAEYNPWKTYSYLGYVPGSYPNKAQYFDVIRQLYPWKTLVLSSIKAGEFPLWNPYNFSGAPLFANFQSAVLYPLQIVFLFFSQKIGWGLLVMLQPLLASMFMYCYARKLSISRFGSLLASVSYAYSQYMIVWLEYNTIGHILAWLPLALLSVEHLSQKKTAKWISVFVFSIATQFFAGHIQLALYSCIFISVYIWFRGDYKTYLFLLFGIGIASLQLIPGFELVYNAARSNHEYSFITQKILIQPQQWIMLLVPDFFGNPATRNYVLSDTYIGKVTSIGLIPLLFVAFTFITKKTKIQKFFLSLAIIIALLISLNPFTKILYSFSIPFISSSAPTLLVFLFSFSLSILAGFGFDQWLILSKKKIISIALSFLLIFALFWVVAGFSLTRPLAYQGIILVIGLSLIILGNFYKKYTTIIICLLLAITLFDSFRSFQKFNPFVSQDLVFPKASVISFLQNQRDMGRSWGYHAGALEANFSTQVGIFSTDGYDPLYPKRYGSLINASKEGVLLEKFSTTTRSDANISQEKGLMENKYRLKILDVLGVKYILDSAQNGSTQIDFPSDRFKRVYQDSSWTVFQNMHTAPRVFLTSEYDTFSTNKDFEKKFFDQTASIMRVLLESKPSMSLAKDISASTTTNELSANHMEISTSSKTNQLLFASSVFYPGWHATIDGKDTPILRANYAFQALEVPAGNHIIVFRYAPFPFMVGIYVSILSLLCFILYVGIARKKYKL